jgi:hypothetical protein
MDSDYRGGHLLAARRVFSVLLCAQLSSVACSSLLADDLESPQTDLEQVLDGGLSYLAETEGEFGVDVAVALQIVSDLTGDPRGREIAEARLDELRSSDLVRYGVLLGWPKPVMPAAILTRSVPLGTAPRPHFELPAPENVVVECLTEVLRCEMPDRCRRFAKADDYWGYPLTHQGVWALFSYWMGCELESDLEALRQTLAARLVAEAGADAAYSELGAERLAMLGHLGFSTSIEPDWVSAILEAQQDEGCWGLTLGGQCHPHPTGVALWALAVSARGQ